MLLDFSLKGVFADTLLVPEATESVAAHACYQVLDRQTFDATEVVQALEIPFDPSSMDAVMILDAWRELATLLFLQELCYEATRPLDAAADACIATLLKAPLWSGIQIDKALAALCCQLIGRPYPELQPVLIPSGAAPVDGGSDMQQSLCSQTLWSWAAAPHQLLHAETALSWACHGLASGNSALIEAARKAALWQLNTLDHRFLPMVGLYGREEDAGLPQQLATNALLFDAVARTCDDGELLGVADRQREHLWRLKGEGRLGGCRWFELAAAAWVERQMEGPAPEAIMLPSAVEDEHLLLAVARGDNATFAATVVGGNTGLGSAVIGDVTLCSYGIQKLPLGRCQGYGLRDTHPQQPWIVTRENGFSVGGRIQVADRVDETDSTVALYGNTGGSGMYADVEQELSAGTLTLKAGLLSVVPHDELAFSFFVNASACQLHSGQTIRPCSLDRYEGHVQHVTLVGKSTAVALDCTGGCGRLHVIPLADDDAFWGANLLVTYVLDPACQDYRWTLQ